MDEIDASLDHHNAAILAHYISTEAQNAQFVVVSHTNHVFELAQKLIGVTKINNCTKTLVFEPKKILFRDGERGEGKEEKEGRERKERKEENDDDIPKPLIPPFQKMTINPDRNSEINQT